MFTSLCYALWYEVVSQPSSLSNVTPRSSTLENCACMQLKSVFVRKSDSTIYVFSFFFDEKAVCSLIVIS